MKMNELIEFELSTKEEINNFLELVINLVATKQISAVEGQAIEKLCKLKLDLINKINNENNYYFI